MKRLVVISVLAFLSLSSSVASGAVLKPLATPSDWGSEPIFATAPPNDGRLFVVERGDSSDHQASIRILRNGVLQPSPFLTIPNVDLDGERGLLSMAFSPDYATSGLFYVFYVANGPDTLNAGSKGDIRIVEYQVSSGNSDIADPASARLVFKTPHSKTNHNGGWLAFGPDGKLFFTIGDDAASSNSQDLSKVFGKVLRIDPADPDGVGPLTATIPADNPFLGEPAARGEVYTQGLRNPFRGSFAPNGDLVIADVGQNTTEEVDAGNLAGKNMGWPDCEGFCSPSDPLFTDPIYAYPHTLPICSAILGGYVVRDPDLAGLTGRYLYGDLCDNNLRTLNLSVAGADPVNPGISIGSDDLRSFGEDSRGCSYVVTAQNVYRVAADAGSPTACPHTGQVVNPPPPPVDTTKPGIALDAKARYLGRQIRFGVKTDEVTTLKTTGVLHARRKGRKKARDFRYNPASADLAANTSATVKLTLPGPRLKAARKLFRSGRALRARMVTTATDSSGNSRTIRFTINIRRQKH